MHKTSISKIISSVIPKDMKNKNLRRDRFIDYERENRKFYVRNLPQYKNGKYCSTPIKKYGFSRLLGILIHKMVKEINKKILSNLSSTVRIDGVYGNLWIYLRKETYFTLFEILDSMKKTWPQVTIHYESLICLGFRAICSYLVKISDEIIKRLEKNQDLEQILYSYISICQEERRWITFNNIQIYFTPDWVLYSPDGITVIDFKVKEFKDKISDFDFLQIILYAWCLENEQNILVQKMGIYYLKGSTKLIEINYSDEYREMAASIIESYMEKRNITSELSKLIKNTKYISNSAFI